MDNKIYDVPDWVDVVRWRGQRFRLLDRLITDLHPERAADQPDPAPDDEVAAEQDTVQRMRDLLHATANALHGGSRPNGLWSWHDLPLIAQKLWVDANGAIQQRTVTAKEFYEPPARDTCLPDCPDDCPCDGTGAPLIDGTPDKPADAP